jgi:methyl-accepting chemotaxis protein
MRFKDMKLRTKLMVSFGVVVAMIVALSAFAWFSLNTTSSSYRNKLDYSQERVQTIQDIRYCVMNARRITALTKADCGDIQQLQAHASAAEAIINDVNEFLAYYTGLSRNDYALSSSESSALVSKADDFKDFIADYKVKMIDVNIQHGLNDDREALNTNYYEQSELMESLQDMIDRMWEYEEDLAASMYAQTNAQTTLFTIIFIVVAAIIAIISVILALGVSGHITKPLLIYDGWMKSTSKGDIVWSPRELEILKKYKDRADEIGTLMASYAGLLDYMGEISTKLSRVAEGDLDLTVVPNSEKDQLAHSLSKMIEDLNYMFREINSGSNQVHNGSREIADGAQSLAQGSTEQAATVQELSASVSDIAAKTKENAELAKRTASLANTIMKSAEKGNQQMDEMMGAVNEINQSSQNISKVIKVIDDIAFQTNILALNAAVEAARAGQHGKGFAVVAEEVRNLAAKSAEAAKDTGGLIANSMEKAELGARIAGETAASLGEIVNGINDSTKFINDIAASSEEQSFAISQINSGIDQVADVVQQNSATAEQSAALSEELSGQSDMLEDLIAKFNLKK